MFELPKVRVLEEVLVCERVTLTEEELLRMEPPLKEELPERTTVRLLALFVLFELVLGWKTRPVRELVAVALPEREALLLPKR